MVNHLSKTAKIVMRRNLLLTVMHNPTDDPMQKGINALSKCTKKQFHQPPNKNCFNVQHTMSIYKLLAH
jgi:hypothetical protein